MPRECNCSGALCTPPEPPLDEVTRRDFLKVLGVGALALYGEAVLSPAEAARHPNAPGALTPGERFGKYALTAPRVYKGGNLGAVAMPIGGIGTGTLWLDGQGRLRVWQLFNNSTEPRVPGSFLALRVHPEGGQPEIRVLQTEPEPGFPACQSLTFEGGYPVARLDFETGLPVSARLEAFNPMIPTDTANSSLPCVIFRVTVRNTGNRPVDVALLSTLQNAVGYDGGGEINGVSHASYGRNTNAPVREKGLTAISMTTPSEPPWTGFLRTRHDDGRVLSSDPVLWLGALDGVVELANAGTLAMGGIDALSRLSDQKAVVVSSGSTKAFFESLKAAKNGPIADKYLSVFEDFEGATYEGWTVEGEGFGEGPSKGALPGQQAVSGFVGRGMVNTFLAGDTPQGKLASRSFKIEKRYLGFLLGGGNHPKETCLNLWVDGKVVRTATGRDSERLEPYSWDVREFVGKEGQLEIVDARSDGWGHVNVDHVVFSDVQPESLLRLSGAFQRLAKKLPVDFSAVQEVTDDGGATARAAQGVPLPAEAPWQLRSHLRLEGLSSPEGEIKVLAQAPNGDPVLVQIPFGKAWLVLSLATDMPWDWARKLICYVNGLDEKRVRFETTRSGFGSMALSAVAAEAKALPAWTKPEELAAAFAADPSLVGGESLPRTDRRTDSPPTSEAGSTLNGALSVAFKLAPGQERTESFVVTWHFPNVERHGHEGNHYCEVFDSALDAARYVSANLGPLTARTLLYHRTVYESNLPEEFLDAMTSQSVIARSPVCWRSADGYFAGYEGAYGCCPLNCTHVWNYAHTHARLFPEIGRNQRVSNFLTYLHDDGETSHREHGAHNAFADGHCACLEAALREHQLSADDSFLRRIYPGVKKAMNWFIGKYDAKEEGVTRGQQWNTYDTAVSGLNTFIGSQYLSALAASEAMAKAVGDGDSADRWRALRERGMKAQDETLWAGEYYIQLPEKPPAHDYNNGCHSDQLLGQWWAHQLGLGYLYPPDRVKQACQSIFRHDFKPDFAGLPQIPRRYVDDGDGGLYMCTWPGNDRPDPFTLYSIEAWTGVEYSTAGLFVHEGLIDEARAVVKAARARYDGRPRQNLNSGGGVCGMGNPFQELECGKFYARAQSSWSLLIASQGLVLDGPAGVLGFKPKWQPDDHRSFFTVPEGWGLFVQKREAGKQTERIELRHGRAKLTELVFATPFAAKQCTVLHNGRGRPATLQADGADGVRVTLGQPAEVTEGDVLEVALSA
jgi:uncharacterized protein (DUF608 family)